MCGCEGVETANGICAELTDMGTPDDQFVNPAQSDQGFIDGQVEPLRGDGGFMFSEPDLPELGCDCTLSKRDGQAPSSTWILLMLGLGLMTRRRG